MPCHAGPCHASTTLQCGVQGVPRAFACLALPCHVRCTRQHHSLCDVRPLTHSTPVSVSATIHPSTSASQPAGLLSSHLQPWSVSQSVSQSEVSLTAAPAHMLHSLPPLHACSALGENGASSHHMPSHAMPRHALPSHAIRSPLPCLALPCIALPSLPHTAAAEPSLIASGVVCVGCAGCACMVTLSSRANGRTRRVVSR